MFTEIDYDTLTYCKSCGGEIYEGDEIYIIDDDCIVHDDDYCLAEWLKKQNWCKRETARKEVVK